MAIKRLHMNVKQKIAIITPPILVAVMYPIFYSLAGVMNDRIARQSYRNKRMTSFFPHLILI